MTRHKKSRALSWGLTGAAMGAFTVAALLFMAMGNQSIADMADFFGIIAVSSFYAFYIVIALAFGFGLVVLAIIAWRLA